MMTYTPYDEDGNEIDLKVSASSIIMNNGSTLQQYIDNLRPQATTARSISRVESKFKIFPSDITESLVRNHSGEWSDRSPECTAELPNLWKRDIIYYTDNTQSNPIYSFQGSLGERGIDGNGTEWIFILSKTYNNDTITALYQELKNYETNYSSEFEKDDACPPNWHDDIQQISLEFPYLYQSTRKKELIGNKRVWGSFSKPKLFTHYSKDGDTIYLNNIYCEDGYEQDEFNEDDIEFTAGEISSLPNNWYDSINSELDGKIIWQRTIYYKKHDNGELITVSDPIRITGEAGEPGKDGGGIEFVYLGSKTELTEDALNNYTLPQTVKSPASNSNWKDTAAECSLNGTSIKFLYCSYRVGKYNSDTDWHWGNVSNKTPESERIGWNYGWSEPFLWSSWGHDGIDGDGVEYIYMRLTESDYIKFKENPTINFIPSKLSYSPVWKDNASEEEQEDQINTTLK